MTDLLRSPGQGRTRPVVYPTSDGKPMAETDLHVRQLTYLIEALQAHFASDPRVYVAGNNFVYYREGDAKACVSPDCYVVFGVQQGPRDCYKAWEEGGKLPDVVFEITSKKTRNEDTTRKRSQYEVELRVPEYYLFDPKGDYLSPRLQAYRLEGGQYVPLEAVEGRVRSELLKLDLVQRGDVLRLYDPEADCWLLTYAEAEAQRAEAIRLAKEETCRADEQARRADQEAQARRAAEEENTRLRAELQRLRRRTGE